MWNTHYLLGQCSTVNLRLEQNKARVVAGCVERIIAAALSPFPCSRTTTTTTISSFDTNTSPGLPCSLSLSQTHPCQPCLILCVFAPRREEKRPKRVENIATRVPTTTSLSSVHQRHHHHHYHHHHQYHHQSHHHHRHELLRVHPMSPSIRNRRFGTAAL